MGSETSPFEPLRHIPLYYDHSDSRNSASNLILALRPEWRESKATIDFVRFTEGITNTVCCLEMPIRTSVNGGNTAPESRQQAARPLGCGHRP
jgi:hypothetical protein